MKSPEDAVRAWSELAVLVDGGLKYSPDIFVPRGNGGDSKFDWGRRFSKPLEVFEGQLKEIRWVPNGFALLCIFLE